MDDNDDGVDLAYQVEDRMEVEASATEYDVVYAAEAPAKFAAIVCAIAATMK